MAGALGAEGVSGIFCETPTGSGNGGSEPVPIVLIEGIGETPGTVGFGVTGVDERFAGVEKFTGVDERSGGGMLGFGTSRVMAVAGAVTVGRGVGLAV